MSTVVVELCGCGWRADTCQNSINMTDDVQIHYQSCFVDIDTLRAHCSTVVSVHIVVNEISKAIR
jgi:hypothetical protein